MAPIIVLVALALLIVFFILYKKPGKKVILPDNFKQLLAQHVSYYNKLDEKNKRRFEEKVKEFLGYISIEGVNTDVTFFDKLLVASSAVIPIFGFDKWKYYNLKMVLLYPATFNRSEFLVPGYEKNTLGMIGNGPLQRIMILSKPALHYGFQATSSKENTGIHEFVHLLDKEDGDVDGLPEALLHRKYNTQWLELINQNIETIISGHSDINYYGAFNNAEFFAVTSEYFFSSPELFQQNHPELFDLMCNIFQQNPIKPSSKNKNLS
jgi:Mlc titration factor MtfA (ptsG expression regulator)